MTVKKQSEGMGAGARISLRNKVVLTPFGDGSPSFRAFSVMSKQLLKYGESTRRTIKN